MGSCPYFLAKLTPDCGQLQPVAALTERLTSGNADPCVGQVVGVANTTVLSLGLEVGRCGLPLRLGEVEAATGGSSETLSFPLF